MSTMSSRESPRGERRGPVFGLVSFWPGVIAGVLVTSLFLVLWYVARDRNLRPLTRSTLEAAVQRWQTFGPDDYELEVETTGRQASVYRVVVRQGEAILATRNGNPLPQHRVWFTWTVPGMFETIGKDLEQLERARAGQAAATGLVVLVEFHPQYGYPVRYVRAEGGPAGSSPDVRWHVRRFRTELRSPGSANQDGEQ